MAQLLLGDCAETLKTIPNNSIDCIVTDPPYGYSFMNLDWDKALPSLESLKQCCRVLKPGAFAFVMSSPRQDVLARMICRLQDAGFETGFTSLYWAYATGFPKCNNTSLLIDKRMGAERAVVGTAIGTKNKNMINGANHNKTIGGEYNITAPTTPEAKQFDGAFNGFNPKPAVEVILVVMKPKSEATYINQAMKNGKGVTWLKDCKIPWASDDDMWQARVVVEMKSICYSAYNEYNRTPDNNGRFPANLLVSDEALDNSDIERDTGSFSRYFDLDAWFKARLPEQAQLTYPCLIVPKPSQSEKNRYAENKHPTVKPLKLMSYLITMGSREGDVILDPFCGSGTTGEACRLLNREFIGCELDERWQPLIEARADIRGFLKIEHEEEDLMAEWL